MRKIINTTRRVCLKIRREPHYRISAFEQMFKRHGYVQVTDSFKPESREDMLVLWNKKRGADEVLANQWEQRGGSVMVTENGYLQKVDKTYYAISLHGHNGSGWFPEDTSEDRFGKLGYELGDWGGKKDGYILVCGQRGIGSSDMASPPMWAEKIAGKLVKEGKHKVRLRLHPGNFAPKIPLVDDLKGAADCYIWSSGSGVRSLVFGVPVKHHAPHWICENTTAENRLAKLNHMAHGQWHHEEIASGEPLARILADLEHATW